MLIKVPDSKEEGDILVDPLCVSFITLELDDDDDGEWIMTLGILSSSMTLYFNKGQKEEISAFIGTINEEKRKATRMVVLQ